MVSRSPDRNTFQLESYIKRCAERGETPDAEYMKFWESLGMLREEQVEDREWQQNNMEYDLVSTAWILEKVCASKQYSQNLYAAMCNNDFVKNEVWNILKEDAWSCSWRAAGGIVADMRQEGDYIDWYCSGMGNGLGNGDEDGTMGYVNESVVTEEIAADLLRLGWIVMNGETT
jgi:hypothetical protein